MPVMDGITAVMTIRQTDDSTPVLALSAHALNEHKEKSLSVGFNEHLTKPISRDQLLRTIKKYQQNL